MTAAAITSDILCKNECPIQGHTFLPNNKNGIMLFHIMMMSMKTAWKWESVNLSSMEKRKVSTFLANEEKKRLLKSGKDNVQHRATSTTKRLKKTSGRFALNALMFFQFAFAYKNFAFVYILWWQMTDAVARDVPP